MPIRLIDPDTDKHLTIQGTTFIYREASGDEVLGLSHQHTNVIGIVDEVALTREIVLSHVTGWTGLQDASGQEVEPPEDAEARRKLLVALPFNVWMRLKSAVLVTYQEGLNEGKGSETNSSG